MNDTPCPEKGLASAAATLPSVVALLLAGCLLSACGSLPQNPELAAPQSRPIQWAQPLTASPETQLNETDARILAGLDNCHRVDARLIRCGQPKQADFRLLADLGVNRVLNLRQYHDDADITRDPRLSLLRQPMNAGDVSADELRRAVASISNGEGQVLVHCWHGSDRTGAVVAAYRILEQGWSKEDAIREFLHGGYGFHSIYLNLVDTLNEL